MFFKIFYSVVHRSNLCVDGCLHYGGAMSGSISYPRVDGVAGYGTTLGIVNYISDKVFLGENQAGHLDLEIGLALV